MLVRDGAVVTNYTVSVVDASATSGSVTGRLTVAEGARLWANTIITCRSGSNYGKGIGIITVAGSNTIMETAGAFEVAGTNVVAPSALLITSQATVRAGTQFTVGHGNITVTDGGIMELKGSQLNITANSIGTVSNRGG